MARPKGGYSNAAGQRIPGASTIAKLISDPGGLIHWAWTEGHEGRDYRDSRQAAADAGTLVHEAAEAWKQGRPPEWMGSPAVIAQAKVGFANFLEWTQQTRLKIEETEISLISETYQYGGTFDATLIGDRRAMCDYKSAARLYEEHLVQLAAYGHLWNEHHPDRPIDGGYYLLRFSRVHGDFTAHRFTELDDAWEAFKHCRSIYDLKTRLKARCG